MRKIGDSLAGVLYGVGGLVLLVSHITDVAIIAPTLQDESGMFVLSRLGEANWVAVIIVTAIALLLSAALFIYATVMAKKLDIHLSK